jgi:hypothetical protein
MNSEWDILAPLIPSDKRGARSHEIDLRAVIGGLTLGMACPQANSR